MSESSPTNTRFWRPVSSGSNVASWAATPMWRRTSPGCLITSIPATVAAPASGWASVVSTRTAVVLPAPLGPSSPRIVPGATPKDTPSSAWVSPYRFIRPSAWIMSSSAMQRPYLSVSKLGTDIRVLSY